MAKRISVTDANTYGIRQYRLDGMQTTYFSLDGGTKRINGDKPGKVELDSPKGHGSKPTTSGNCGCE